MMGWGVDILLPPRSGNHIAVVNEDCPDLDHDKEEEVELLVHGADEHKHATGQRDSVLWTRETYW